MPMAGIDGQATRMLLAVGLPNLIMMGSTFSSLGVVLPPMMASLGIGWGEAGFGFTVLGLAAGLSSMLPGPIIRRWGGRASILAGVVALMLAYATLASASGVLAYDLGALLLGLGFGLIGAVPGLHILGGWARGQQGLVFGLYLAFGGLGGLLWPSIVEGAIAILGGWRPYWWFMAALIAVVGAASLAVIRERPVASDGPVEAAGWTLREVLRTPQFYVIGCGIAATYLVASTVNAFAVSQLTRVGVATMTAVILFSIQSGCHAAFPILMGGLAGRIGVKTLLVLSLAMQAVGMLALAVGSTVPALAVFAVGVGGGYGTNFLATTLALQSYFGRRHYAAIFGSNQLFTTISVVGPALVGYVADRTGRFDISFGACAVLLTIGAAALATLRPPGIRATLRTIPAV